MFLFYFSILSRINFTEVASINVGKRVYHIKENISDSTQLIISTSGTLSSVKDGKREIIIGTDSYDPHRPYAEGTTNNARFNMITGFVQTNGTSTIIAVDRWNHCLRNIRILNNEFYSETFAGKCTHSGNDDGLMIEEARFNRPHDIIEGYYQNEYYVTDHYNNAIRLIILKNSSVVTIRKHGDNEYPTAIALDRSNKILLVSVSIGQTSALIKMDIDGQLLGFVKARAEGITAPNQFGSVKDILTVTSNRYLVTDWGRYKVYLLELAMTSTNATIKEVANVTYPYSIALSASKDKLYVGESGFIKVFNVSGRINVELISPSIDTFPCSITTSYC